jgi:hypothetical protein|uniref:Sulfatase-modifying factor enzyme 1 n=1 Tax=Myoviridae sp. ct5xZ3 TaxID=2827601 RepID=A0A8S5RRS6_9CAUD|nr:MAG TPA: Sulfatase-modifying factor enzyme 1 [Myoviridae sp. ct5xZ3]
MANYDQMAAAVKEISGGKNIVLLNDVNLPSIYVPFTKHKYSELITGGSENIHLAHSVNGVEKSTFYYSKYQNVIINGRAYSLAHRDPATYVNWDQARQACEQNGAGFHLATMAEWAEIALWCRKNGTMPHGNNNYGADASAAHERGEESAKDNTKTGRTFTGSGPATWGHDWTQFGIQDMNGNVWEWVAGMRLKDGEIQIIPYNNAAMGSECDMSASSTLWKAIKNDGSIVDPGSAATLKYDWVSNHIQLTTGITTAADAGRYDEYAKMTLASGITAPELAKALLIYPDEPNGDYAGDGHWMNNSGERLPICGGYWADGAGAGVFGVVLGDPRTDSGGNIGFRSAYVEL